MSLRIRYCLSGCVLLALLATRCQFDPAGFEPWNGPDPDGTLPDASPEASVGPDGGGGCVTGQQRCYGAAVELCVDGQWIVDTVCDWGCNFSNPPYPYCGTPYWAESVNPDSDTSAGVWVADDGTTTINTDDGTITFSGIPIPVSFAFRRHYRPDDQPPVAIFGFEQITIPVGAAVVVQGSAALALVANDTIVIGGELLALGHADGTQGPGGAPGGVSGSNGHGPGYGAAGELGGLLQSGGGGAGGSSTGGAGATVTPLVGSDVPGGAGGPWVDVTTIDGTLVGGSGGGGTSGDMFGNGSAAGGGGGGAVMLAARTAVEILGSGVVNVGGGGGGSATAGGGGGAGGMVLIQSAACSVVGVVAANGGGGGDLGNGQPGAPGQASAQPAAGGGTHGGAGGAGLSLAGSAGSDDDANGGGGGGAAGIIRIDTVLPPDLDAGTLSPSEGSPGLQLNDFPTT